MEIYILSENYESQIIVNSHGVVTDQSVTAMVFEIGI